MPDYGPNQTPILGLFYGGDSGRNENWDKLDQLVGTLAIAAGLIPDPAALAKAKQEQAAETQRQQQETKPAE